MKRLAHPSSASSQTVGTKSIDALWAETIKQIKPAEIRPEDGWRTLQQIASDAGLSERTAYTRTMALVKAGKLERQRGGGRNPRWYFRPVADGAVQ